MSRRGETESVARVLGRYLPRRRIEAPGTIDGGDVLRIGDTLYVWCRVVAQFGDFDVVDPGPPPDCAIAVSTSA